MSDTENTGNDPARPPGYAAGAFFLVWAAVGWYAILFNDRLMSTFGTPQLDPGPALLPIAVCSALTAGGLWFLLSGFLTRNAGLERVAPRFLIVPALFLITALLTALLIRFFGFRIPAFSFTAIWLFVLGGNRSVLWKRAGISVLLAAVISVLIQVVFVQLLRVPLP